MWYTSIMNYRVILFIILLLTPVFVFGTSSNFPRNLSFGVRGEDVRELQKFLNKDVDTRIAETGLGSFGNETDYFGYATKRALIKFQEKYREEILAPSGLVSGTGIFGAKTRGKMIAMRNSLIAHSPFPSTATSTLEIKGMVTVMFPSQYSGKAGTTITISGAGFTSSDNTIYFGDGYVVEKALSWNGQEISINVPEIPKGNYSLSVKNTRGESNRDAFFVVTDGTTPEPKVESIYPLTAERGTMVTINGAGFTAKGNTIRTSTNIIKEVPSVNGTSVSFVVPASLFLGTTTQTLQKNSLPIWVYIVNENGVSNGKSFTIKI